MKKIQAIKVRIAVFIFLFIMAMFFVVPTHKKLNSLADNFMTSISKRVEKETGLILSYSSLSPSILSTFSIRDISISEKNGEQILAIDKIKINYNLIDLIKKDIQKGVKNILIDGISVDVSKIITIINKISEGKESSQFDYQKIKKNIPNIIKFKNISLNYSDKSLDSKLFFKDFNVNNNEKKQSLNFNLNSVLSARISSLDETFSCSVNINGTIPDSLENSTANLKFDNITNGEYKLNKLNLLAKYSENAINLQTIKVDNPFFINASYNLKTGVAEANVKTEKLSPASVITTNQINTKSLKNLLIDTNTLFSCNVNTKKMNYSSNGSVFVPDNLFSQGAKVEYSISGNENKIDIKNISVEGPKCVADANFSYTFSTMQTSGFAELPYYLLENGKTISTELYFDPLDKGFMVFSPQFFIGDKALTAIQISFLPQNDSYDFVFEAYDYSHLDSNEPGVIKIDGSYLNNYFQGGVSLNNFFLDSFIDFALQLFDNDVVQTITPVKKVASDIMFTGDIYASTDFKSISFNVPYFLLANTKKDNQFVMMAMNGNEQSVQLNQFSFIFGKYAVEASASLDRNPDTKDMFFVADLNADSVPYHFSGTIMPEVITITGDYGIDAEVRFGKNNALNGHVYFDGLPIKYSDESIVFSTESEFTYDKENGPLVAIKHFDAEGASAKYIVSPKLLLSGNVTKYGAQIDSIAYTDFYSALEGTADVMVNVNDGIFDSVGLIMNVKNPLSEESINMDATISNPEHLSFDAKSILDSLYINSQIQVNNLSLNRVASVKNDNNLITASLFASGTLEHPYVALGLDNLSIILAGNFLKTWGSVTLEDKLVSINDFNVDFQMIKMDDLKGVFDFETFEGLFTGSIDSYVSDKNIHVPLELKVSDTFKQPEKLLPDSVMVTLSSDKIDGSLVNKPFGFDISALYSGGEISLFSSDNLGLFGSVQKDGTMMINVNCKELFTFNVSGISNKNNTNVEIGDINVNLKNVCSYFDIGDFIDFEQGNLEGSVSILNSFNDPIFFGALAIHQPVLSLPTIIPRKISALDTLITIANNEIQVQETEYSVKGSNTAFVGCTVYMNKWNVDHSNVTVRTGNKNPVIVKMITPVLSISGDIICNLSIDIEEKNIDVSGTIAGENVNITSDISSFSSSDYSSQTNIRTDIDIVLGNHAALNFEPLLRCIFVPNTHIAIKMDQEENLYEIEGQLKIKSGDIAYLNRSFYIKEGSIKFNKADFTNPLVTLTAETREKDDDGQSVKIILSAENQYLLDFQPKFSSIPAKSEYEIQTILGQIVVADSTSATNFLFAAGDYAIQSAVFRKAENKLREVMNFDIFSLRTNFLQNALILSTSGNSINGTNYGNLLDNSTVYVGKYLGSSLYFDAMLHITYEDYVSKQLLSSGNLLFQPEFGLELESPFGNIRWNMAPDINALMNNQFVPSTSVTLSWKFAF